jgi:hypothetical protein
MKEVKMALPKNARNTYEDDPEKLKDLIKNGPNEEGQKPETLLSRQKLLDSHEKNLQFLRKGRFPMRNIILPLPYVPSRLSLHHKDIRKVSTRLHESRDTD